MIAFHVQKYIREIERLPYKEDVGGSNQSGPTKQTLCKEAFFAGKPLLTDLEVHMQNTVSKAYNTTNNADGSTELVFKSWRWGAIQAAKLGPIMLVGLTPVACTVTYPAMMLEKLLSFGIAFPVWMFASMAVLLFAYPMIRRNETRILVKPNEGLVYNGTSIPFSDISSIGVSQESTTRDPNGSSYVYVETHGQEVRISGHTTSALATAVKNEIKKLSGQPWA